MKVQYKAHLLAAIFICAGISLIYLSVGPGNSLEDKLMLFFFIPLILFFFLLSTFMELSFKIPDKVGLMMIITISCFFSAFIGLGAVLIIKSNNLQQIINGIAIIGCALFLVIMFVYMYKLSKSKKIDWEGVFGANER